MDYTAFLSGSPLIPWDLVAAAFIFFLILLVFAYLVITLWKKEMPRAGKMRLLARIGLGFAVFILLSMAVATFYLTVPNPHVVATTPKAGSRGLAVNQKIAITFDRPVSRGDLKKTIRPYIPGVWIFEDSLYRTHLFRRLTFYPDISLLPETSYQVDLEGLQSLARISPPDNYSFTFTTQDSPKVQRVVPDNLNKISPNQNIQVYLTAGNDGASEFNFAIVPQVAMAVDLNKEKNIYTLKPQETLAQGASYELDIQKSDVVRDLATGEIIKRQATGEVFQSSFTTPQVAGLVDFSPKGNNVALSAPIVVRFSKPMDKTRVEKNFSSEPSFMGETVWPDDKTFSFQPGKLEYGTRYTVKIAKGAPAQDGSFLPDDAVFAFTTIGRVVLDATSPGDGWQGVSVDSPIKVTFDQEVDHSSAQEKFRVEPALPGAFSWEGKTLAFTPNTPLNYSTIYTVTVAAGVKSLFGLDSDRDLHFSFTTVYADARLNVPIYLQQHTLSCEAATLRMVLAYRGVDTTEDVLLNQIGFDPTPHEGNVWGDPDKAFVGSVDGSQMTTGYGVHWGPIARVAQKYRGATAFQGWTLDQVTAEIARGNPVIVWTYSESGVPMSWLTPLGVKVAAIAGEHAVVVVGFVGPAQNPSQLIVNDPLIGQVYWHRNTFEEKWQTFGRSGVVVY